MTDRELMQEALYALTYVGDAKEIYSDTIESLRARLAQPEQEIEPDRDHVEDDGCPTEKAVLQRFWREHQKQEPVATLFGSLPVYDVPPKQEPVAWVENLENARPHCVTDLKYCSVAQHERGEHLKYIPLYTAPPQCDETPAKAVEWQGLTYLGVFNTAQEAHEAYKKEKNNAV